MLNNHMKQILIVREKRETTGFKNFNDSKAFIEYSNNMDNVYIIIIEEHIPNKKQKFLSNLMM